MKSIHASLGYRPPITRMALALNNAAGEHVADQRMAMVVAGARAAYGATRALAAA